MDCGGGVIAIKYQLECAMTLSFFFLFIPAMKGPQSVRNLIAVVLRWCKWLCVLLLWHLLWVCDSDRNLA